MKNITITLIFLLSIPFAYAQQNFTDVSSSMGITGQTGLGHAVGWGDIDNDGYPELGISNQEGDGFWFYHNDNGTHFSDITASAGLSGLGANKIIIAEVTGDRYNDLILRTRNSTQYLFKSNGDGTFDDITASSGISGAAIYNIADFDNDGLTDLLSVAGNNLSILYNNGDETFSQPVVIAPLSDFWGVAVLDYDRDGNMDIYTTTYGNNANVLWRNNGDGTFSDETAAAGLTYNKPGHGLDVGDFNNDGYIDVYVGNYSSKNGKSYCALFKNNGDGTFTDIAAAAGTSGHNDTRTVTFADYDSDGYLDIFSSHHDFYTYSNTMLHNNGDETFTNTAGSLGISGEFIGDYFGVGWADYDRDGAMDFFAAGHIDKYNLFHNNNCPGTSIEVRLKGIISNHNGIGARVTVWLAGNPISRYLLPNGGFHDFSDLTLHFGLNGSYCLDSITVYWPSGIVQRWGQHNAGEFYTITEDTATTGISKPITGKINVYPNPATDYINISFPYVPTEKTTAMLFNENGLLIKKYTLDKKKHIGINVEEIEKGIYFLMLQTGKTIKSFKVSIAN